MKISCTANNPDDELCTISPHDLISKLIHLWTDKQILTQVQLLIIWKINFLVSHLLQLLYANLIVLQDIGQGHNWSAETELTLNYKLGEYYKYKANCLSNVLHCYSIHFKLCHFCFESATLSKSYCIGIIFLKLLFYIFIIIREIIRWIECLGAINLRLMQRIMTFVKVN